MFEFSNVYISAKLQRSQVNSLALTQAKQQTSAKLFQQWSPQQDAALVAVNKWLCDGTRDKKVFRLFGYAGTGKTTLANHLASGIDGKVLFAAFTGKAALVMKQNGCPDATTIHSLIYKLDGSEPQSGNRRWEPKFKLNEDSVVRDAALVVIDECSMVDAVMGRDLLSFGKPILVLGDPVQLPSVKGGGYLTNCEPDIMLTEVHRQAAESPIIRMSMKIREGGYLAEGDYGDKCQIISRRKFEIGPGCVAADQILCGRKATRHRFNAQARERLGFKPDLPELNDKLVCLRNDRGKGLLNGSLWRVKIAHEVICEAGMRPQQMLSIIPDEDPNCEIFTEVIVNPNAFGTDDIAGDPSFDAFDYGYALTVHKAQGSQWRNVVLFDESRAFREHWRRWLYTGITRAMERITIIMGGHWYGTPA